MKKELNQKERYQNSLAKCDLYDNPFNPKMQLRPELVRQRQALYTHVERDSTSSRGELEKKLFLSFKKRNFELFSGNLQFISRMVRMLFLAVMLPVFVCLYRLPQWILVEMIPKGVQSVRSLILQTQTKIKEKCFSLSLRAKKRIYLLFQPFILFFVTRIEKGKRICLKGKEIFLEAKKRALRPIYRFFEIVFSPFKKIAHFISNLSLQITQIRKKLVKIKQEMRAALIAFPQIAIKKLRKAPEELKEKLIKIEEAKKQFFSPVTEFFQPKKDWLIRVFKKYQNVLVERYVAPVKIELVRCKMLFESAKEKTIILIQSRYQPIVLAGKQARQQLDQWVKGVKEKLIADFQSLKAQCINKMLVVLNPIKEKISLAYFNLKNSLKKRYRQLLDRLSFLPLSGLMGFTSSAKYFESQTSDRIERLRQQFVEGYKRNKLHFEVICLRVGERIARGVYPVVRVLHKGIYHVQLGFIWSKILLKHGIQIVREKVEAVL